MVSLSPAYTLPAAICTIFDCGQLTSVIWPVCAIQSIWLGDEPSSTAAPGGVGHVGSVAPDSSNGSASQVISDPMMPSQMTWLSVTVTPSTLGQAGSVAPLLPGAACVAS